jgi:hypothetical protein
VIVVRCQVEITASGLSLFQTISTERGVSESRRKAIIMMEPWLARDRCAIKINIIVI